MGDRLRFDPRKPDNINTRVEAALLLARIHLTGQGTARNPAEAYRWWKQALDYGFEPAGTLLGQANLSGIGTALDARRALTYLQSAAEAGHVPALLATAYAWLSLCKAIGHPQAEAALASVAAKLTPEERTRVDAMLKPKARGS